MAATLPRRAFLGAAAIAAASACTGRPAPTASPTGSSPTRTPAPGTPSAPRPPAGPAAADWTALGAGLAGELVRPADAGYAAARQLFDPRYDAVRPAGIAYCTEPADVQECLRFATRYGMPVTARAGGHSYAGWSTGTGLVLDVTGMRGLAVDAA
jgi:hypothetical protein